MPDSADRAMDRAQTEHENRPRRKTNKRANTATTSFDNSVNNRRRNRFGTRIWRIDQRNAKRLYWLKIELFCMSLCEIETKTEPPFPTAIGKNKSLESVPIPQVIIPPVDSARYRWRFVPNELIDSPSKKIKTPTHILVKSREYCHDVTGSPSEPKYEPKKTYPEGVWK